MNNYKFRFRSRDWTQFDEADFMKQMKEAEAQGVPPEEFLKNVGMSRDEVVEYLQHRTDTDPELAQSLYFVALLTNYGFEWSEAWHMIREWDHFSEWLVENYDGPKQEIPEDLSEQDPDDQIEAIEEAMKENEEVLHTVGAYVVFSLMGLEPEKVSYIVRHPDEFIEWVRENYDFPEDMDWLMYEE